MLRMTHVQSPKVETSHANVPEEGRVLDTSSERQMWCHSTNDKRGLCPGTWYESDYGRPCPSHSKHSCHQDQHAIKVPLHHFNIISHTQNIPPFILDSSSAPHSSALSRPLSSSFLISPLSTVAESSSSLQLITFLIDLDTRSLNGFTAARGPHMYGCFGTTLDVAP